MSFTLKQTMAQELWGGPLGFSGAKSPVAAMLIYRISAYYSANLQNITLFLYVLDDFHALNFMITYFVASCWF